MSSRSPSEVVQRQESHGRAEAASEDRGVEERAVGLATGEHQLAHQRERARVRLEPRLGQSRVGVVEEQVVAALGVRATVEPGDAPRLIATLRCPNGIVELT